MAKILVVDDEPAAMELLVEFLSAKGYEVITATNGQEAIRRVKEDRPHLVLLDVEMPKMNGMEALRRIREIDPEVGVIMATGVDEEHVGRKALEQGAFDYIVKPLDLKYLERSLGYKIMTMLMK
jgi:two-component system response regulator AtoC